MHFDDPGSWALVPMGHGWQVEVVASAYWPAGHSAQPLALAADTLPALHVLQLMADAPL